ncbi:hypothetical protein GJ744_006532 [Endocarpon pusillum]|uniref:Uncharacterized protein n=1 Tax=Endocarpon pusillum TaxID=364733 RepID=A0A8H7ARJ3_9EURO|nr:hypothetical protein GJ744_006532 [Endocarpon pusillum]
MQWKGAVLATSTYQYQNPSQKAQHDRTAMKHEDQSPKKCGMVGNHAKEHRKGSRMELTFISEPHNAHLKMLIHKSRAAEFVLYPGFQYPSFVIESYPVKPVSELRHKVKSVEKES